MANSDLSGRTLGNCTLEKLLGQGGMGAVYLAKQERPARYVAVKTLQPNLAAENHGTEEFLARFRREADVIARLEHVNIMPIYEYGEQNGIAYLVMPHISGGSLKDVLQKRGSLTLQEAMTYIDQAASALDYAHAQGVVHRDLKPANFLLHADGRLVLADFGIARIMEESVTSSATLTTAGTILGTPEYMAPEMASGGVIDYRADIYELGIVLYQMLTGQVPFTGSTPYAVVIKQIQQPLPSARQSNPALPAAVDGVLQRATAKQPDKRYQSAQAMAQALRQASSASASLYNSNPGQVPSAYPPPPAAFPPPANKPLVLSATPPYETRSTGLYRPGNTAWNNTGQSGPGYTGFQSGQYPEQMPLKRQPWGLIIGIVLLLIFVAGGGVFASMLLRGQGGTANVAATATATTSSAAASPTAAPSPTPTPMPSPTPSPTAMPSPTPSPTPAAIPAGTQIYASTSPGCTQDAGQWASYNNAKFTCQGTSTLLKNVGQNNILEGMLLIAIAGQNPYPGNYAIQTQMQEQTTNGDFGIYFRNQPGAQNQGVYTFMVHADNTWSVAVYDNQTGAATSLRTGQLNGVTATGQLTLTVVANGSQFNMYVNGQYLTSVTDGTYPTGTVGLVVSPGTSVQASNFVLSGVATS